MRIRTIRLKEIVMTPSEHEAFVRLLNEAAEGRTTHSASQTLDDGSVLQVTVDATLERDLAMQERSKRDARYNGGPPREKNPSYD